MIPFTQDELTFLERHHLRPEDVHDGRRQTKSAWQKEAKDLGKKLVYDTLCRAEGHRLKTRSGGHCVQCDPKKIAYQNRFSNPGYVYIAGSLSGRVVKIGTAGDVDQRQRKLRGEHYGGFADWVIVYHMKVSEGGRIEQNALAKLLNFKFVKPYIKDGAVQEAGEMLKCSFGTVLKALSNANGQGEISDVWRSPSFRDYEFK